MTQAPDSTVVLVPSLDEEDGGLRKDSEGWARMYRRVWTHPVFRNFQEAAVFVWMVSEAAWKPARVRTEAGPVMLGVGDLVFTQREISDKFNITRHQLKSLLDRMVADGMISVSHSNIPAGVRPRGAPYPTKVAISNYLAYQHVGIDVASDEQFSPTKALPEQSAIPTIPYIDKNLRRKKVRREQKEGGAPGTPLTPCVAQDELSVVVEEGAGVEVEPVAPEPVAQDPVTPEPEAVPAEPIAVEAAAPDQPRAEPEAPDQPGQPQGEAVAVPELAPDPSGPDTPQAQPVAAEPVTKPKRVRPSRAKPRPVDEFGKPIEQPGGRFADMPDPLRADFLTFFTAYGRDQRKREASRAYARARAGGVNAQTLLDAARTYALITPPHFRRQAFAWLDEEQWLDQPVERRPERVRDDGLGWLRTLKEQAAHAADDPGPEGSGDYETTIDGEVEEAWQSQ